MSIRRPFNLNGWITQAVSSVFADFSNKNLYNDAGWYIVMIVGGPNARKDYHWNK